MQSAEGASSPVISLRDAGVTYSSGSPWARKHKVAARHIDLDIRPGETVGLVGESGSGKTTVGRLILGLVAPDEGEVLFDGRSARGRRSRRGLAVVLQHPEWALNPFLRLRTSLAEPLVIARVGTRRSRRQRAVEMLEEVGLEATMAGRYPGELSGGQRQRAAIARALITRPRLVVFDEAVSALDVSTQAQVLNLIRKTQGEYGYGALFISHDLAAVRYVSHRVAVMYSGSIVAEAPAMAFYGRPHHPYALALLGSTRESGGVTMGPPDAATTAGGCPLAGRCPFADSRCREERPALRVIDGQRTACHRAEEI